MRAIRFVTTQTPEAGVCLSHAKSGLVVVEDFVDLLHGETV